jgi:hypothetical protein
MTTTSGNINSTTMVVQAFLNMTQDISQGVITQQSIDIDCKKNTSACNKCIETAKKYKLGSGNGDYSTICPSCYCTLENVKMNNYITIDFDAFQKTNTSDEFKTQIQNSLTQQATKTGTSLFNTKDGLDALSKTSTSMYSKMKTVMNENILQQLKNFQVIGINNPNSSVINVDMDLTIDFLSKVIQQTESTASIINQYESNIIQLTTEVTQNGITVVITWIVTLFIIAIVVGFFIFGINIVMDVFMLYAMT